MNAQQPDRVLAHDLAGFDLVPPIGELLQPIKSARGATPVELTGPLEAGQG
jgi:hypothetical protein